MGKKNTPVEESAATEMAKAAVESQGSEASSQQASDPKNIDKTQKPKDPPSPGGTEGDVSFTTPPEVMGWVQQMGQVPLANVRGAGSTQENRCTPGEIEAIVNATVSLYGIHNTTALTAISEMVRRGGANASTPESFSVEIKCESQNVVAIVSKRDISGLVSRHANGKSMRNLAEGMAEAIVRFGVDLVRKNPGLDRPGDLAKKVENRLSYEKQKPLSVTERVGCASYAQWLPNLNQLVGSDRLKSLLAKDLELRKQGRVQPQPKAQSSGGDQKNAASKSSQKNPKKKNQGKKKK